MTHLEKRVRSEVSHHEFYGKDDADRHLVESIYIRTKDNIVHEFKVHSYVEGWSGLDLLLSLEDYPDTLEASYEKI